MASNKEVYLIELICKIYFLSKNIASVADVAHHVGTKWLKASKLVFSVL